MNKIVIFEPRSGSTFFAKVLSGKTHQYLGECLNSRNGILGGKYIENNRLETFNQIQNAKYDFVIKITPLDFLKLYPNIISFLKNNEIFILRRKNTFRQILSFLYMSVTRQTHIYDKKKFIYKNIKARRKHFDIIIDELKKMKKVLNILKENNLYFNIYYYEDFEYNNKILETELNINLSDCKQQIPIKNNIHVDKYFINIEDINKWLREYKIKEINEFS